MALLQKFWAVVARLEIQLSLLIGGLIAKYLDFVLVGFAPCDFHLEFRGDIVIENITISPNLFQSLGDMIPWDISFLQIKRIRLHIPLLNLLEDGLALEISGAKVQLNAYDLNRHRQIKRPSEPFPIMLQSIPPVVAVDPKASALAEAADTISRTSNFLRVLTVIISRTRAKLDHVQVQIYDSITNIERPHCLSVSFSEIVVASCDEKGVSLDEDDITYRPTIFMAVRIGPFRALLGRNDLTMANEAPLISHNGCIILSSGVRLGTTVDHDDVGLGNEPGPFISAALSITDNFRFDISNEHMASIWDVLHRLSWWGRCIQTKWLRPLGRITDGPVRWWKFGYAVLNEELNTKFALLRCTTWSCVILSAQRRRRYIRLYKKYMLKKQLTAEECIELSQLDLGLPIECLRRYRAVAQRSLPQVRTTWDKIKDFSSAVLNFVNDHIVKKTEPEEDEPDESSSPSLKTNSLYGSYKFSVFIDSLSLRMSIRSQITSFVDLTICTTCANCSLSSDFTKIAANLSVGELQSAKFIRGLTLCCSPKPIDVDCDMQFTQDHTLLGANAKLADIKIYIPGQFIGDIMKWLSPTPMPLFYLIPPTLFQKEITEVLQDHVQRNIAPAFRMRINAEIGPLAAVAHTGFDNGPQLEVCLGQVVVSCCDATNVDMAKFPEFSKAEHIIKGEMNIYDQLTLSVDRLNATFDEKFDIFSQDESKSKRDALKFLREEKIEAAILILTSPFPNLPYALADISLPSIKASISAALYRVVLQVMSSFATETNSSEATADIDTILAIESAFSDDDQSVASNMLVPYIGSRMQLQAPSVEVVLLDNFANESLSVWRLRTSAFRTQATVKSDGMLRSSIRVQFESWYLNHVVHAWEPFIEPWTLALSYMFDGISSSDMSFKGDIRTLNITFSTALAETLVHVCQTFGLLPAPKQTWQSANIIVNETGVPIVVASSSPVFKKEIGSAERFTIPLVTGSQRYTLVPQLQVELADGKGPGPLRVPYGQSCLVENGLLAATVSTTFGYVTIRVHSMSVLKNTTGHDLDVAMQSAGSDSFFLSRVVPSNTKIYLPIQIVEKGMVMVRLHGRAVGFSVPIEIMPAQKLTSGAFDLVLKAESKDAATAKHGLPTRSDSTVFALQSNATLRLLGHQHALENQLVISISPMVVVENLLFSSCIIKISSLDGGSEIELHDIKCGDKIECFLNESNMVISVTLPGCSFSEPFSICPKGSSGISSLFKNDIFERGSIGIPSDPQAQTQKIFQNYISYEIECHPGQCPIVRLFASFWMVNHTPKKLFFICGQDKSRDPANIIPTYPAISRHGVPMLMAGCDELQSSQVWLQTSSTTFSDPIDLAKQESGVSFLIKESDNAEYEMRLKIVRASGRFSRTKIVFIMPQLVIVNTFSRPLYLRQNAHDDIVEIPANSRKLDYLVPEPSRPRLIRCSLEPTLAPGWSGLFAFNVLGHNYLSIQTRQNQVEIVECIIKQRDNIVYAVFRPGDIRFPPCRIENDSRFSIEVSQTGLESWVSIPPFSKSPFCWLEPLSALGLDARFEGSPDTMQNYDMEAESSSITEWRTAKGQLLVTIAQDESPSKILRLEELVQTPSNSNANVDHAALINKSCTILESCIKFAEKQYKKDLAMVQSMKTRPSKLYITIVEAWDIPSFDRNGLCDPYLEIIAGESKDSTPVRKKQVNVHFHHSTVIQIRDGLGTVLFRLMDHNVVKDEVLGGFEIKLQTLMEEEVTDAWYKVFKLNDKEVTKTRETGQVRVIAQWIRTPEGMKSLLKRELDRSLSRFKNHLNHLSMKKELIALASRRERASVITSTREGIHKLLNKRRSTMLSASPIPITKFTKQRIVSGKFRIGLISARNCLAMDSSGLSDPYCKILYGSQSFQSKVIKKTLNPDWDQTFEFEYESHPSTTGHVLRIAMFDQDQASEDDFMGEVVITINDYIDVPAQNAIQEWHPVISLNKYADDLFRSELGESAVNRGDVLVEFEWTDISVEKYEFNAGIDVSVPSIGVSIVDSGYQRELMYLSVIDTTIDCIIEQDWKDYVLSVSIGNLQIDNPDVNSGGGETSQMVILGLVRKASDPPQPMLQLVVQSRHLTDLFDFFPYVNLLILGMSITLNTKWLSNVLWMVQHLMDLVFAGFREPLPPPLLLEDVPIVGQESGRKVFFGVMIMSPLSIAITLRHGISGTAQRRTDYDWILKLASSVALENCRINLNALGLSNHVSNYDDLLNLIIMHYIKNAATAAIHVLGSSDLLGNPVQLVSGLGNGVKDFFFEPAAGLALGPAAFGRGLLKGSAALISGTLGGVANSASKVTGNLGNLAAAITMDEDYKAKTRRQQLQFNAVDASGIDTMVAGGTAFSRGIFSGVTGVLVDPIKGAKQDGVKGFVKGIGKGLVGVVTKPISGTLQLASAAAGGVRNAASNYNKNNHRRPMLIRFPRHFYGIQRRIKLYCTTVSKGKFLLDIVYRSKYRGDDFIDILDLPDNKSLILSSKRLLMVSIDASEAITHTFVVDGLWTAPIEELTADSLGEKYKFEHNAKQWEVDLSQVPPQQIQGFFKKLEEMILFAKEGSVDQKYWMVVDKDDSTEHIPLSPLPESRTTVNTPENGLSSHSHDLDESAQLESDLERLRTGLSAAVHNGTMLEVDVAKATNLALHSKMKTYCEVSIQAKPSANLLLHQNSLKITSSNVESLDSVIYSEPLEHEDSLWGLSCRFPMNDPESYQLKIKVYGKRLGRDKVIGQAICDLDGLKLEQEEHRSLPLLKMKQGVQVNRGVVEFTIKLCNPHVVSLQAQMEIAKHKMIRAVKKTIMAQRFAEDFYPNSEHSVIHSEAEQSETVISEAENSQWIADGQEDEIEDSLRRQYRTLSDRSYLREASLRDLEAMVQFEIIKARSFKIWSKKKSPGMRALVSIGGARFVSETIESWEPNWQMKFIVKMPQTSPIVHMKVQRKTFLGAKTIGKVHVDFESLVARASVTDGAWIGLNKDGLSDGNDFECEIHVRIQIKSEVLEELLGTENAVADELHLRSN